MQLMKKENGFSRVNLYEQIADYIEKEILLGTESTFIDGKKLPPGTGYSKLFRCQP